MLLVVRENVGLNNIALTNAMTLVGQFGGRKYNSDGVKNWAFVTWKDHVSLFPDVFLLPRGWIAFKIFFEANAALVLTGVWRWDNSGLLLKIWTPLFDPRFERYDLIPIWVKLPNIPFESWSVDFFKLVGNTLGTYL